jgi:hypothetical protein
MKTNYEKVESYGAMRFLKLIIIRFIGNYDKESVVENPDGSGWIFTKIERVLTKSILSKADYEPGSVKIYLSEASYIADYILGRTNKEVYLWYTHPKDIGFFSVFRKKSYSKLSGIVFQNSGYYDCLRKSIDITDIKIAVAWGGVDDEYLNLPIVNVDKRYYLIVARKYERKNPDLIKRLAIRFTSIKFVVVGPGWEEDFCDLSNVSLYSSVDDLIAVYDKAKALIVTGVVEGGPIPVLEACARDINIISPLSGIAGTKEWSYEKTYFYTSFEEIVFQIEKIESNDVCQFKYSNKIVDSWDDFAKKFFKVVYEN